MERDSFISYHNLTISFPFSSCKVNESVLFLASKAVNVQPSKTNVL